MAEPIWKSWNEVRQACQNKRIVLFGRSEDWVHKTTPNLPHPAEYIADNNRAHEGTSFAGISVRHASTLAEEKPGDVYLVITTGSFESVVTQLNEMGFTPGSDFCCSPAYRDFGLRYEMKEYEQTLLVSCSDYSDPSSRRYSKSGGGLYRYQIGPNESEKVIPGHFRQVTDGDGVLYAVEFVEAKVYVVDRKLNVLDTFALEAPNACGIARCPKRGILVVANPGDDSFTFYEEKTFKKLDKFHFSDRFQRQGVAGHHINDLCIVGDSIFVSYFSFTGNREQGVLDGGVSELLIDDMGSGPTQLVQNLWMPHSVEFLDGNLCYADSMRGTFYNSLHSVAGKVHGFARGLTYDNRFYYVGQSEDIYMSRLFGISDNIMLNAGFYMFDLETKVSRFHAFMEMTHIHDLCVL